MAKVAIKNENITSFGGIYHIMDVFSKLGFEKLTVCHISDKVKPLKKDKQAESLYPAFCQRTGKMGANRKAEHSEPMYK